MGDLRFDDVSRTHARGAVEVTSLSGVSISIPHGSFVTISGPSGSGKSTMLQLLGLLDLATSGRVVLDGADTSSFTEDQRAGLRRTMFGFIFQSFQLMPGLTAWENVALPRLLDGKKLRNQRSDAEALLAEVGLSDRVDHRPSDMSGGEQQRVAIARALITDPAVVLADEPTGALDQTSSRQVIDLLERLTVQRGRTLILVTHDPTIATRQGARRIQLRDGRIEHDSEPLKHDSEPLDHDSEPVNTVVR